MHPTKAANILEGRKQAIFVFLNGWADPLRMEEDLENSSVISGYRLNQHVGI